MTIYPGSQQVAPMKYANKPDMSKVLNAWSSGEWVAQEKKDGAWYQLEKTDDGAIYLFGRTLSKKTGEYTEKIENVPHIKSWASCLPNGTTLIGEIYVPGGKSNDVTKIMGCTAANAYKRQFESDNYGGPVCYYIFDCIRYHGVDLLNASFIDRYEYLKQIQEETLITIAPLYYDNFEEHLKNIFAAGGEGMVFKNKNCPYRAGMRTTASQMFKYKEHLDSIDLVCMELLDPIMEYTGKELQNWPYWYNKEIKEYLYAGQGAIAELINSEQYVPITKPYFFGWKNAMRLGAYKNGKLVEVCRVASGLTDALRKNMAEQPEAYLNKVIEIECMSLNKKDGTVRHPVFLCVRFDKNAEDCVWEEIFN